MSAAQEKLLKICEDLLAPLIRADGGELFVVAIDSDSITLHLAGKCSGCPGAMLTSTAIIEPALRTVAPAIRVVVTSGFQVPEGAAPVVPAGAAPVAQAGAA
jgi:Fe-S cluster biogenesis protein NfuA